MSVPLAPGGTRSIPKKAGRPRALADIQYNSIANSEPGTSSEEDNLEIRTIAPVDAQELVSVSLGRAQTRQVSTNTPAGVKASAIDEAGGFFEGPPIPENADLDDESDKDDLVKSKDAAASEWSSQDESIATRPTRAKTLPPPVFTDGTTQSRPSSSTRRGPEKQHKPHHTRPTTQSRSEEPTDRYARRPNRAESESSNIRLPSPWRAGPRVIQKSEHRSSMKDATRQRAHTGPGSHTLDSWRDTLMSSIPSLPKHFTFNSPFSHFGHHDGHKNDTQSNGKRSSSIFSSWTSLTPSSSTQLARNNSTSALERAATREVARERDLADHDNRDESPEVPTVDTTLTRQISRVHSTLRRSTSDTSLQTFRSGGTLSRVPSLGDDSRFEHVQEQVNSRLKAIRDSWQDSNIKLPTIHSLSHLSLNAISGPRAASMVRGMNTAAYSYKDFDDTSKALPRAATMDARPTANIHQARAQTSAGLPKKTVQTHPNFAKALANLTGDVVVLGGYRGSILRSAEAPHRQLWVPIKVGLNIRKVDLELGLNKEDDERAEEKIIPSGMLTHIGPVDISRRLFKRLRACDNAKSGTLRVHDYGYDWRLEPLYLSKKLIEYLEKLPCNQPGTPKEKRGATMIVHSLGGLITRHAVNQRPDLFAGVVYAGVPSTCVNILGPFRNGDDVLISSRVLTAQVNFTIRTSFALLPLNGRCFFNRETKEEYPVDFFDPQQWIDNRWSPCLARPLPPLTPPPPPTGLVAGIMSSVANALPTRKGSISSRSKQASQHPREFSTGGLAKPGGMDVSEGNSDKAIANNNIDTHGTDNLSSSKRTTSPPANAEQAAEDQNTSVATAVTISRDDALAYLTRILASVKKFKQELAFEPRHKDANVYPPAAVIYGKTTPTVYGARVVSREAIKHADAYDDLAFASGDGVVLARAAMLPEGYEAAKGGIVSSERGHVTLLGDLEAVGRCLRAVQIARRRGVGMGLAEEKETAV